MNTEVYDALVDAGADETKAREAAKSVAQYDSDIAFSPITLSPPRQYTPPPGQNPHFVPTPTPLKEGKIVTS